MADPAFAEDTVRRARWLESVRDSIQKRAVDPVLVKRVRERIQQIAPGSRWILRSSTNAEDLAGFTGAGLYRSIRIKAGADDAQIAAAIAEVWASVWLQGAFEERAWYRVDHAAVGMAILVQPYVDGAIANGVAITANPFTEQRPGFFVNAQTLAGSVTGAGGDEVPEQHLIYTYSGVFESELLAHSSRMAGATLLSDTDLRALGDALGTTTRRAFHETRLEPPRERRRRGVPDRGRGPARGDPAGAPVSRGLCERASGSAMCPA